MFNSATLAVILLYILSAILLHLLPFRLLYIMQEKKLIQKKNTYNKNDYKNNLIFSIINFIASFAAMAVAHITDSVDYYHITIPKFSYLSLILVAGIVEFFCCKVSYIPKIFLFKGRQNGKSRSLCRNMRTVLHIYCKLTDSSVYNRSSSRPC